QVVGVNTAILSPNGGSIGIGFSMASNVVRKGVDQLKEYGTTRRGWLGVRIQDVTPDVAEAMGLAEARGALVTDVPDGPAKEAGILSGDVITSFNGSDIKDVRDLTRRVADAPIGEGVQVTVLRDGKSESLSVKLGRREEAEAVPVAAKPDAAPQTSEVLGMTLSTVTDEMRAQLKLPVGATGLVVTKVDPVSEAYSKGLRDGDVITEAGQQAVASIEDLTKRIADAKAAGRKSILLLVRSNGDPRFVALGLE
ncbi:MAG: PDZ domain-containing protein, partial [Anaerolineae bacterium]|nr:PDZ domain-containing protein [Anaerolineae bacterium]